MHTYFWFIAGILAGAAAMLLAYPLFLSARHIERRTLSYAGATIAVVVFAFIAFMIYGAFGSPQSLQVDPKLAASSHPSTAGGSRQSADSMESAVARVEARVKNGDGSREDWLLLAQSYEFLGRAEDAAHAREQAGAPAGPAAPAVARGADALRASANGYRQQREYARARDAFGELVKLDAMDADSWADYADVLASLAGGSLRGDAAKAIDRALARDPRHAKALWLRASLAHEERDFAQSLVYWKQLRGVLPATSSDVRIVDANIEEATRLAVDSPAGAGISGTVSVDRRFAARIPAGATLFIYAKAVDSPGPPLAVLRADTGSWPVRFRLDDTLAMIPSRKLSQFDKVVVEARVSRTGQATPATGDLFATSAVLTPAERKPLALVINREVS